MLIRDICVIAIILASASADIQSNDLDLCSDTHDGPCKRSSQCEPLVIPKNSTHLRVNWENAFEGCEDSHIEKMVIEIVENLTTTTRETVKLSQKEASVEANPCLQHIIRVKLSMTSAYRFTHGRSYLKSLPFGYNKVEPENDKYPFGGLLQIKVVPKICLKANGTISIPSPPEALQNCGVKTGDAKTGDLKDSDFDEVGVTSDVKFGFKHPKDPSKIMYKTYEVKDIQACTNDDNSLVIAVAIIATLVVTEFQDTNTYYAT